MNINQQPRFSYLAQLAMLLGGVGVFMIIAAMVIGVLAANAMNVPILQLGEALKKVENANAARWFNTITTFVVFLIPSIIFAIIISRKPFAYLGFNGVLSGKQFFLVLLMAVVALMLSSTLGELNQHIPVSAKLLAKARASEKEYSEMIAVMANMKNWQDYLFSLFVVAICPAVFEEVLFRGGFQKIFIGWTKNMWVGIIITSVLFSAIHFSYFGFLARAGLGVVLGLTFYYSKNIWLNIALHFLNNGIIITIMYSLSRTGKSAAEIEKVTNGSLPYYLVWLPVSIGLLYVLFTSFKKESNRILPVEQDDYLKKDDNPFANKPTGNIE